MTESSSNPYAAPIKQSATVQRTRWRITPVIFITIFGGMYALFAPALLILISLKPSELGGGLTTTNVAGCLLFGLAGAGAVYSARCCWKCRWWRFAFVLAASIGLGVLANNLLEDLNLFRPARVSRAVSLRIVWPIAADFLWGEVSRNRSVPAATSILPAVRYFSAADLA